VVDGEIVAVDRRGVSRFQLVQRRTLDEEVHPAFAIFDCLERSGVELLPRPLVERRRALEAIVPSRRGIPMRARRLPANGLTAYRLVQKQWLGGRHW
jgi:ATP-dependent DNA ligase